MTITLGLLAQLLLGLYLFLISAVYWFRWNIDPTFLFAVAMGAGVLILLNALWPLVNKKG